MWQTYVTAKTFQKLPSEVALLNPENSQLLVWDFNAAILAFGNYVEGQLDKKRRLEDILANPAQLPTSDEIRMSLIAAFGGLLDVEQ